MFYDNRGNSEDDIIDNIPLCARRLDAEIVNWFTKINIRRLDLLNSYGCILGQLYGNLDRSLRAIKMLALWLESDGEFPCIYDVNKSEGVWRIGGF